MNLQNSRDTDATYYDLTKSQLLLWLGQKLKPDSPMYNMAIAFDLPASIDFSTFTTAFRQLVDQCDAMRTVFEEKNGQARQKILNRIAYELPYLDFSKRGNPEAELDQWLRQRSRQVFDIEKCLFDSVLIKVSEQRFLWFFNQHHLITDAWAVTVQYKALASLYARAAGDAEAAPEPLPKFADYIRYEAAQRAKSGEQEASEYWTAKGRTMPAPASFYGHLNPELTSHSERVTVRLDKEKVARLKAMTMESDLRSWTSHLSLFTIFSTLLYTYIYRVSGQQQIAIGTPAHNRSTAVFKETPGIFIELFPIITTIDPEDSFSSLLQKVRIETYEFLRYAQAGTSNPDLNRSFNVVLNYINASFSDFNGIPVKSEWVHADHADPGHHLRLQVHDFDASGCIDLCFDMNTAIFDAEQRKEVPRHFLSLLDHFIEDRFQQIGKPSLVSGIAKPEQTPLEVFDWYNPAQTIINLWDTTISSLPAEAVAIKIADQQTSYGQLEKQVNQLSHYLQKNGLKKGDRVAILLERSPEFIISVLAALKSGATFIPVPINYPSGRVLGILEDAQPRFLLSHSKLAETLPRKFANLICLDREAAFINQEPANAPTVEISPEDTAYILYTSGSTGLPKGVVISHRALSHYIQWARHEYAVQGTPQMPLFTSLGFDLTITSIFLPLVSAGTLHIYPESAEGPDLSLFKVIENKEVNLIKLTPSHLALLKGKMYRDCRLEVMIVGGENFQTDLASFVSASFPEGIRIYNEYGPTEATVGCVVHQFDPVRDSKESSVPIGLPIPNMQVYILDEFHNPVPDGVVGELYLSGAGLADGYWKQKKLTEERFVAQPWNSDQKMYRSGDLVRKHSKGYLEYLGRKDLQVKIRGRRVELAEIEAVLNQHPKIDHSVVELRRRQRAMTARDVDNCIECGLPSNYPSADFDDQGVCQLCRSFSSYQESVKKYFSDLDTLKALIKEGAAAHQGEYDCLMLLSGGKDSSYALAKLKELGFKVLAFTLDNGYISEEAKANVRRVVGELGVEHVFGETEAMDAIFVDSLQRHCNVCDGCFKTIYTLSTQLALEKKIPFIVTGLSRGQFFETRLTEELFRQEEVDVDKIDEMILNARKAYHQVDDAVRRLMDVSMFEDDQVFEKVRFIDFYRYSDVSLDEMLDYLKNRLPWVRPSDTGRSTNCLINKAGIYVHKKEMGYSNYAFPYSWDVRVGHKTRDASLEEINEEIDEKEVKKILDEIGYTREQQGDSQQEQLVGYYLGSEDLTENELKNYLSEYFPDYMIPVQFIRLEKLPVTVNGKVDRAALPRPDRVRPVLEVAYAAPETEFEELICKLWSEVLQIKKIGIHDNFIRIGGDSLSGIRVISRLNEDLDLDLPVTLIFQKPTVFKLAGFLENKIKELLHELDSSETASS